VHRAWHATVSTVAAQAAVWVAAWADPAWAALRPVDAPAWADRLRVDAADRRQPTHLTSRSDPPMNASPARRDTDAVCDQIQAG
jgi:hypothetical protein